MVKNIESQCPGKKLEGLIESLHPLVFKTLIIPLPSKEEVTAKLKLTSPWIGKSEADAIYQELQREETKDKIALAQIFRYLGIRRADYSGDYEEIRKRALIKLRVHVNNHAYCRNFYLGRFMQRQIRLHRTDSQFFAMNESELIKYLEHSFLDLMEL